MLKAHFSGPNGRFVELILTEVFDTQRAGVAVVLLLLAVGFAALLTVDEGEG